MNDVYNYIFKNLKDLDKQQTRILKTLKKNSRTTTMLGMSCAFLAVRTLLMEMKLDAQNEKIDILSRKIKELEAGKADEVEFREV